MRVWSLLLVFAVATARAAEADTSIFPNVDSNTAPSSLIIDGFTYENVRWGRVTPSTATIFHKTGVATVPLEKLPLDLQEKVGYDPVKAEQYRQAEAKARAAWLLAKQQRLQLLQEQQAAKDEQKKLQATAVDFHCSIMALDEKGAVVRTASTFMPQLAPAPPADSEKEQPAQIEITYAFLVGHPRQAALAVGDTISCRAYRDGEQQTGGDPLPRWVFVGEARRRIPPPPPP